MSRPDIDPDRLLRRLRELSAIGREAGDDITRPGFSQTAIDAGSYIASEARAAGLTARTDAGGNLLIGQPGRRHPRALLAGSHLDMVINGGWLDGAYGVVAALEALQVATDNRLDPGFDLVAVAFANEEGALFPYAFWGSMVLAGMLDALPDSPVDYDGCPLREALTRAGGDIDALGTAVWPPRSLAGYLELHIENQRADALLGAAHLAVAVSRLPERGLCRVATAGRLEASPGSANTIAGSALVTADLRDSNEKCLAEAESAVRHEAADLAAALSLTAQCRRLAHSRPTATDPWLRQCIADAASDLELPVMELPSGAGHDARIMATVTPVGMIFTPSIGRASHVPEEDPAPADLIKAARVLLGTVLRAGAACGGEE